MANFLDLFSFRRANAAVGRNPFRRGEATRQQCKSSEIYLQGVKFHGLYQELMKLNLFIRNTTLILRD